MTIEHILAQTAYNVSETPFNRCNILRSKKVTCFQRMDMDIEHKNDSGHKFQYQLFYVFKVTPFEITFCYTFNFLICFFEIVGPRLTRRAGSPCWAITHLAVVCTFCAFIVEGKDSNGLLYQEIIPLCSGTIEIFPAVVKDHATETRNKASSRIGPCSRGLLLLVSGT